MPLFNSIVKYILLKRMKRIEYFMRNPHVVQQKVFDQLIEAGKETAWGQEHQYGSIKSPEDFKKRVPVSDYSSLKPYIDRCIQGEDNILWNTPVKWFAKSSGTTSDRSKFIPMTKESLHDCHFKGGTDMLSMFCNMKPDTEMFSGKSLALGGSSKISREKNHKYMVGDLSAVIIENLPIWAEYVRTPGKEVTLHDKWEEKIDRMAEIAKEKNVTSISGVPSWTLVLLKKLLEITGKQNIKQVWPGLEVFFHGGVNFTPYREQYNQVIPEGEVSYVETYNASEGFFAIQDREKSDELLLLLDYGIYYEFMPLDQLNEKYPNTLGLQEVKTNTNYALIITTNGGLWRYLIGDTVQFTSLDPYRIQVTGRTKNFINAVGEEIIIDNAEKAMAAAAEQTGAVVNEYTAAPVYFSKKENAAHEWLIEFEQEPDSLEKFSRVLDETLRAVNSDYDAKRYQDMVLRNPVVKAVPRNTFYHWMKQRGKLGGQHKVPRLANDRKHIEQILKLI